MQEKGQACEQSSRFEEREEHSSGLQLAHDTTHTAQRYVRDHHQHSQHKRKEVLV